MKLKLEDKIQIIRFYEEGYSIPYLSKQFNDINELVETALEDEELMSLLEIGIEEFKEDIKKLEEKALLSGKYDMNNVILEIHPGAGGTESMDWADMLYRMYNRFCARNGFKVTLLDYQAGDEAGIKSVTIQIDGDYAYLKNEEAPDEELKCVARALLPGEISEGTKLAYEMFQYSMV